MNMGLRLIRGHIVLLLLLGFFSLAVNACTQSSWSAWINDRQPSSAPLTSGQPSLQQYGGDEENMNATALEAFCAYGHGTVTNIVCLTANNDTDYIKAQGSAGLNCRVSTGFQCSNKDVTGGVCLDYKIQLYCNCTNPLTSNGSNPGVTAAAGTGTGNNNGGATGSNVHANAAYQDQDNAADVLRQCFSVVMGVAFFWFVIKL